MTYSTFSVFLRKNKLGAFNGAVLNLLNNSNGGLANVKTHLETVNNGVSTISVESTDAFNVSSYSVSSSGKVSNFGKPVVVLKTKKQKRAVFEVTMVSNGVEGEVTKPYSLDLILKVVT